MRRPATSVEWHERLETRIGEGTVALRLASIHPAQDAQVRGGVCVVDMLDDHVGVVPVQVPEIVDVVDEVVGNVANRELVVPVKEECLRVVGVLPVIDQTE